ncbi:MAG: aminopeptidase N C-terminal domain-containing protein, partial [Pseudomonadota bacterium]
IRALLRHEAYDSTNPNKVRALIGVFGRENLKSFHSADGAGYRFFAEQILLIDEKNPQLAARLITLVENWRKLEPARQALAKQALEDIAAAKPLSSNVYEMATRLLKN